MIKYITIGLVALAIAIPLYAGYDIQSTALPEPSALYNRLTSGNTMANEIKADLNLLRTGVMYRGNGPAQKLTSGGAVVASGLVADGTSVWTLVTHEVIDNSIAKFVYATAEILAWQSGDTLEAGERCYYVALFPSGTTETDAKCITILQSAEYNATTETALYPTIPAGYIPICSIHVISTDAAFVPSVTNFNATGCTSTIQTIEGPIPSGASNPTAISATDLSLKDQ